MSEEVQTPDSPEQSEAPLKVVSNGGDSEHPAPISQPQNNISLVSASDIVAEENVPPSEPVNQDEQPVESKPANGEPEPSESTYNGEKEPEQWIDILGNKQLMKKAFQLITRLLNT